MTPEQRARLDAVRDGFARVMTRAQYELMNGDIIALLAAYDASRFVLARLTTPRPFAEWLEEDGSVLWWRSSVGEPPYVLAGLSQDRRSTPSRVTEDDGDDDLFWTPIPNPRFPR